MNAQSQEGFRLLTEYHSFLCKGEIMLLNIKKVGVSVSLRSIIHSYYEK